MVPSRAKKKSQGRDHLSTKDVLDILAQLRGSGARPAEPESDAIGGNDDRGGDSPMNDVKKGLGAADGGGGEGSGGASQMLPQGSEASLLSQFPPTQEMPRAVTQSPIPLPPRGGGERVPPERDDAMRMSPPVSAG